MLTTGSGAQKRASGDPHKAHARHTDCGCSRRFPAVFSHRPGPQRAEQRTPCLSLATAPEGGLFLYPLGSTLRHAASSEEPLEF